MTAKEKANELIERLRPVLIYNVNGVGVFSLQKAKQCALIYIDEMMSLYHTPIDDGSPVISMTVETEHYKYLREVKREIESL